jgi:quercetin dioxygenase-like cupin family protein
MRLIPDASATSSAADPTRFTGAVQRTDYIEPADAAALAGSRFRYQPGARSHWHVHEREQAIIAVEGRGLVAWEGLDAPHLLVAGDWWHVEPGVRHWHGATPDSVFAHLAVTAGGATLWHEAVSEDQYHLGWPHPVR